MNDTIEKFTEISEDTQEFFNKILAKINTPYQIHYGLVMLF